MLLITFERELLDRVSLSTKVTSFLEPHAHPETVQAILLELFHRAAPSVSPERVFWGLGERWWMQVIDGRFHHLGAQVFDRGRPGRDPEPGYYHSIERASHYAAEHVREPLTLPFYQKLHQLACAHLDIHRGEFHQSARCVNGRMDWLFPVEKRQAVQENWKKSRAIKDRCIGVSPGKWNAVEKKAYRTLQSLNRESKLKLQQLDADVLERSRLLGQVQSIATFQRPKITKLQMFSIHQFVRVHASEEIGGFVQRIFDEFEAKMSHADSAEAKLRHIADLYQVLEWLHPFEEGQTRTDGVLLSKELCRHGFHPAILDFPCFSLFMPLDSWVAYLKQGMSLWLHHQNKTLQVDK
jgi:hypothetical protein